LRAGDALRLIAVPEGVTDGAVAIGIVALSSGTPVTNYVTSYDAPVAHQFADAGLYRVTGVYHQGSNTLEGILEVSVVGGGFPEKEPVCWEGKSRLWDCPQLPAEAVVEGDEYLSMGAVSNAAGRFSLLLTDTDDEHWLVARLGRDGPVLDSRRADGMWLRSTVAGSFLRAEILEDGSWVFQDRITTGYFPATARIVLQMLSGGMTFEDGTRTLQIEPADLDGLGEYTYRMIVPAETKSSACHATRVYQGPVNVGGK
jgi:hypothetical protein